MNVASIMMEGYLVDSPAGLRCVLEYAVVSFERLKITLKAAFDV